MIDWKPDENKNCEKCKYFHELFEYPATREELGDWGGNNCSPDFKGLDKDVKENLGIILENIDGYRGFGANEVFPFEDKKKIDFFNMIMANICPLYKEQESQQ